MNPPITPKSTTDLLIPDPHSTNGGTLIPPPPPPENLAAKRQRRPSVRLGDIGDQTYDPIPNRRPRKGPRSRNPLDDDEREREGTNLVSGWRKPKTKGVRVRSNWAFPRDEDVDDEYDDVAVQDSPVQSLENRVSKDFEPSDTETRNNYWNGGEGERNGIRVWLNQLGLGRYAPVFEIHEVDDEVLPMLTIEDLRDMGINAVGSRRKMFCAIQKLSKGFS